jgi:hypothetical protein
MQKKNLLYPIRALYECRRKTCCIQYVLSTNAEKNPVISNTCSVRMRKKTLLYPIRAQYECRKKNCCIQYVLSTNAEKKPVISNTGNFFCFDSNVSNLYNNDVIIYKIKKKLCTVLFLKQLTSFSYYNIGQIIKLIHKKNCKNIGL